MYAPSSFIQLVATNIRKNVKKCCCWRTFDGRTVSSVSLSQGRDTETPETDVFEKSLVESKKSVYLQHNNVMPKGNEFNELGIQPSLNAFFFSQEDPKPRDVVQ